MDTSQPTPETERRHSFRISERVHLHYRELSPEDYAARPTEKEADPSCALMANLRNISIQAGNILSLIRKNDPDIAQYLALQDRKIELLGRMLEAQYLGADRKPNMEITLSAEGLDLHSETPLAVGTLLAIRLLCFPSYLCLELYARVEHVDVEGAGYRVGVEFIDLSETQRELLIRHMLEQQSAQLRQRHARQEAEE